MKIAVLVPRKPDHGRRDLVWAHVRGRWDGWDVHEGYHDTGPFNRSAAINQASRSAGDWDVAVIADSDSFVDHDQLRQAITGCLGDGRMWLAYTEFCYITEQMSDKILNGYDGDWTPGIKFTMTDTCSSMVVVRRDVWDQAGGFDEGFESWGMEDVAASHAFQTFGGGITRVPGPVWHLWHPPSTEAQAHPWEQKLERAERYHRAAYDRAAMTALLRELGVVDDPETARPDGAASHDAGG